MVADAVPGFPTYARQCNTFPGRSQMAIRG
jgi:hypothetical protein